MSANYWSALTDKGAYFLASKKLSRVQLAIVLYFISNIDEDNMINHSKKSDIKNDIKKKFDLDLGTQHFYEAFSKLENLNIIVNTENNKDLKKGYMLNPFIAYKGGNRAKVDHIRNYVKCVNGKWEDEDMPEDGFTINGKKAEPFDKRMFNGSYNFII